MRHKIELPETFAFFTDVHVHIAYINYGNHVGHDGMLSIIHEARLRYLKSINLKEVDHEHNYGLVMADLAVQYKRECLHGMQLRIGIHSSIKKHLLQCHYQVLINNQQASVEAARACTTMACVQLDNHKVRAVPECG